jgi:hypothetical protein
VLLNLSNHPAARWEPEQRVAALALAPRVEDLPFPVVEPSLDEAGVAALAEQVLAQVPPGTVAAMVQGEFTLTFRLVRALEARGVPCFAATTAREVVERGGEKLSTFRFVRFRRYGDGG